MKKITVISGVSGVGKTTLINNLSTIYNTKKEIKYDNPLINFYYKETIKKDFVAKKLFITNVMIQKFITTSTLKEDTIFDRWIIDFIVEAELRIKGNDLKHFQWLKNIYTEIMKDIKHLDIVVSYIIIKPKFEEFKKRFIKRDRANEASYIKNNNNWYKNYFDNYYSLLQTYLDEAGIKFTILDTTENSEQETFKRVKKIV